MSFSYLLEKIREAPFASQPFQHIHLTEFFRPKDFDEIVRSPEITTPPFRSDDEMFRQLFRLGYKTIEFPGCITDYKEYILWHRSKNASRHRNNSACEGFGVTLRLMSPSAPILRELSEFLDSDDFQSALAQKFGLDRGKVIYDAGIQKYLDGYEISPHPDTRRKALTYMVNINPGTRSEFHEHHTKYLKIKKSRMYVQTLWENNPQLDRCWVPWDWCETIKSQPENNSIVMFAPSDNTFHAVKANYDHLAAQRTQLCGNFWFSRVDLTGKPEWEDLDFIRHGDAASTHRSVIPALLQSLAERVRRPF